MEWNIVSFASLLAIGISVVSGSCVHSKYSYVSNHTGCISKSSFAQHMGDMTPQVKNEIVNTHNNLRASMNATNMQKMVWDEELAVLAQKWADNCEFKHDSGKRAIPGRFSVGQNLGIGHRSWSAVLNSWWDEVKDFKYDKRYQMNFARVGHFTQMAWHNSAKVGCGWASCTNPELMNYYGGRYYVCNYGSAGNNPWWRPYNITNNRGDSRKCSSCPTSCDSNGLCDCGGKVCENGGTLNLNTCQCSCLKSFHVGNTCELDCSKAEDSRFCGMFWIPSHCQQFTNVPHECPNMCGLCPLADFRNQGTSTTNTVTPPATVRAAPTTRPTTRTAPTTRPTPSAAPPPAVNTPSLVNVSDGVYLNVTGVPTTNSKNTTGKFVDITIEEKNGKTVISIPNEKVPRGAGSVGSNGSVRVAQVPSSGVYSTLVLVLQLV